MVCKLVGIGYLGHFLKILGTADLANFVVNGLDWQCCLAGSSKTAPRILIFSIAMGADYSFYVKTIETHARAFLTLNILAIGSVGR